LQNATVVARRLRARLRLDPPRRPRRTPRTGRPRLPVRDLRTVLAGLTTRVAGPERIVAVAVAALVLVASVLSVSPATGSFGATGNTDGAGSAPRIGIAGLTPAAAADGLDVAPPEADGPNGFLEFPPAGATGAAGAVGGAISGPDQPASGGSAGPAGGSPAGSSGALQPSGALSIPPESPASSATPTGPYLADGTLLKPVAVDTTVPDGAGTLRTYQVRAGDTLTGIARRFGLSMMTLWWANDLTSKDELHVGQTLVIPPVNGLVVQVKDGDTLASIAARTGVTADEIVAFNGLTDRTVIIGQTLVIPGARGEAIPTPAPRPQPVLTARSSGSGSGSSGGSTSVRPPVSYSGGPLAWPVPGGHISQYFHPGHYALDIAADWGSPVRAAAAGTVVFAGWKSNGGGYQVWLANGSGLYTAYYHMSALTVGAGQSVARGQQIGRIGATGWATGPHLHFEVWRGPMWDGGSRVNPLNFF